MSNILSIKAFDEALNKKGWDLTQLAKEYDNKYPSDAGKTVYNTLRKWRNPSGNPTLKILVRVCDLLECDVDYLLGRIEEKTHESKFIKDKTGLSEQSIDILIKWRNIGTLTGGEYSWARNSTRAISDLLEQDQWLSHDVLNPIAEYCCNRNLYENPSTPLPLRTTSLNKYRLALFTASNGLMDCIKSIYQKKNHH